MGNEPSAEANLIDQYCQKNFYLKVMIKEKKNIDFYTTGRQPSEQEFARISEWIRKKKERILKKLSSKQKRLPSQKTMQ